MLVIDDALVKTLLSANSAMLLLSADPAVLAIVWGTRHFACVRHPAHMGHFIDSDL